MGNSGAGILITNGAASNTVGGTAAGAGNTIAFSGKAGVALTGTGTIGDAIRANSIHDNGGLGIDLGNNGVTLNDSAGHIGPNNFEDFPVLTSAIPGSSTEIIGTVHGAANVTIALDFYANTAPDPSGYGEGQFYLASRTVITNASGDGGGLYVNYPTELVGVSVTHNLNIGTNNGGGGIYSNDNLILDHSHVDANVLRSSADDGYLLGGDGTRLDWEVVTNGIP